MAKDEKAPSSTSTAPAAPASTGTQQQIQLKIDEAAVQTFYSSTSRLSGTAEEIVVDFSQGVRPGEEPNTSTLKIDARVILSPWAAKRLAMALGQTIQRYEAAYGTLEIDPRKRLTAAAGGSGGGKS